MRQQVRDVVSRVIPERWRRRVRRARHRRPRPGLPPGLEAEGLGQVVGDALGAVTLSVSHTQISGWRKQTAGTFRVFLETSAGEWSVVYKNAVIDDEETPGLRGLPVRPDVAEYLVYRHRTTELEPHLPGVYRVEEIEERRHYRYLLADLQRLGFRSTFDDDDILWAAGQLGRVQRVLTSWGRHLPAELPTYDRSFSTRLRHLARRGFEEYSATIRDAAVARVLASWTRLEGVHLYETAYQPALRVVTHGDANRANLLTPLGRDRPLELVDWEWAGWAVPHADLASLLKGKPRGLVAEALRRFAVAYPDLSPVEHRRLHDWARVETRLFDCSYMIAQHLGSPPGTSRMDLPRYIHVSARELLTSVAEFCGNGRM